MDGEWSLGLEPPGEHGRCVRSESVWSVKHSIRDLKPFNKRERDALHTHVP